MRLYKDDLRYNQEWKKSGYGWSTKKKVACSAVCKKYGKPPVQARGAWVQHPVSNWVKATELLNKHEKSKWHKVAFEKHMLAEAAAKHGDILQRMARTSEKDMRRLNLELTKKLIRSLFLLIKHHMPHMTTFTDVITLQINNEDEHLKVHKNECASNASCNIMFKNAEKLPRPDIYSCFSMLDP